MRDYGDAYGVTVLAVFPMPKRQEPHSDILTIDGFYGAVSKGIFPPSIVNLHREKPDIVPHEWLPIAAADYHNIFLSLSSDDIGHLYFLHDFQGTDPIEDNIYFLANSFNEFVEQLETYSVE